MMRETWGIVGLVITVIGAWYLSQAWVPSVFIGWDSETASGHQFAMWMWEGFPQNVIFIAVACFLFFIVEALLIKPYREFTGEEETRYQKMLAIAARGSSFGVVVFGTVYGWLPPAHNDVNAWATHIVYPISWWVWLPSMVGLLVSGTVEIVGGRAVQQGAHDALPATVHSLERKYPDSVILPKLAAILRQRDAADGDVLALYRQLSPVRRWMWKLKVDRKLKDIRAATEIAQKHAETREQEARLAETMFNLEREKRRG